MAIIDPVGFLCGERIGSCSDEAQFHWPRLVAASNSYGRLKLDYESIIETVYRSIKKKPSPEKLAEFLMDYRNNWLLFVYVSEDGETWGEWLIPDHLQRNYHTAADRRTPAPPAEEKEAYRQQYLESVRAKKSKSNRFNDIFKPLLKTEILNTSSEISQLIARDGLGSEGMDRDVSTTTKANTPQAAFVLPDFIPRKQWDKWLEVRKKKRADPTEYAMELAVKKLRALREKGHDPGAVLDEAILSNWTGIFEPKGVSNGNTAYSKARTGGNASALEEVLRRQRDRAATDETVLCEAGEHRPEQSRLLLPGVIDSELPGRSDGD